MRMNKSITAIIFDLFGVIRTDEDGHIDRMIQLIRYLRSSGYAVGLLSNVDANYEFLSKYSYLFAEFDRVLLSSDIGVAKPMAQAYFRMVGQLGAMPEASVMIDDKDYNLEGARRVGIKTIQFVDYLQLIQELEELGVEIGINSKNQ
jgi:HAD superfamily hydrolase (TIGR01509 family)